MMTHDSELESFKTEIDLRAFAAEEGYLLDRRESWRGSSVLRHPNGDKIIVRKDHDGHFTYFSVRDDRDNGSIIDFVQQRYGGNLGQVRQRLRPWLGKPAPAPALFAPLEPTTKDRLEVERQFRLLKDIERHAYLEETRCLPMRVLASARFAGRIKCDARGNAVFPHFDQEGLCGYEIKNRNFTGYAKGGEKGLWLSHLEPTDQRLVICESAIDALSYATLFPAPHTRYASLGGQLNPKQPELLQSLFQQLPPNSEVVAATDADADGRTYADLIATRLQATLRSDLRFTRHEPTNGKDWNEELQREYSLLPPAQRL
jgi:hypothetical protein